MNSLIWLWLYSLVSSACNLNYAMWSPGSGMTVINDLIPALPEVSVKDFETMNEGIDADLIGTGEPYKVPYSSEMQINKPAKWAGNCPKTLLLLGKEETPSRQTTLSTLTQGSTNTPLAASGTTTDHTAASTTSTQKAGSPTNSKPTGIATGTKTPTPGKAGSKKSTGTATGTETPTPGKAGSKKPTGTATGTTSPSAKPWTCWPKDSNLLVTSSKEIREKAVNDICRKFKGKPLTSENPKHDLLHKDLILDVQLGTGCKSKIDEAVCLTYFEVIERECSGHGGLIRDGCAQVSIQRIQTKQS